MVFRFESNAVTGATFQRIAGLPDDVGWLVTGDFFECTIYGYNDTLWGDDHDTILNGVYHGFPKIVCIHLVHRSGS
jgi:hypothetical protein